ncbi:MAG TPA: hypothetical protein PK280_17995 [Planctomycetota bacterium]|nr:hypothetical protein [Planctomycetota bacterium]
MKLASAAVTSLVCVCFATSGGTIARAGDAPKEPENISRAPAEIAFKATLEASHDEVGEDVAKDSDQGTSTGIISFPGGAACYKRQTGLVKYDIGVIAKRITLKVQVYDTLEEFREAALEDMPREVHNAMAARLPNYFGDYMLDRMKSKLTGKLALSGENGQKFEDMAAKHREATRKFIQACRAMKEAKDEEKTQRGTAMIRALEAYLRVGKETGDPTRLLTPAQQNALCSKF